jgi:hypothetical protein
LPRFGGQALVAELPAKKVDGKQNLSDKMSAEPDAVAVRLPKPATNLFPI